MSATILAQNTKAFAGDRSKSFLHVTDFDVKVHRADLVLSLDVLYHLVEDDVFETYMQRLFAASQRWVIIYSSNHEHTKNWYASRGSHVRHRMFSSWVRAHQPTWHLVRHEPNPHNQSTAASFFVFEMCAFRIPPCPHDR